MMRVVVLHPYIPRFVGLAVRKIWRTMCVRINGPGDLDLLTLKLVYESHQMWRTFIPNLGSLGLRVLELVAMYATDGRKKAMINSRFPTGEAIIIIMPASDSSLVQPALP